MNKYKYLGKNVFLFTISSFGSKLLSFLFVSFYTAVLTTEEYGIADLVWASAGLLIYFVTLNISDAVVRFALERKDGQKGIFTYGLKVILKGHLVFAFFIMIFAYFNPVNWDKYLYIFLYLTVFTNSLQGITSYYLRSFDEVKTVAIVGVLATVVSVGLNILFLLFLKLGVVGYLSSLIISNVVSIIYSFIVIKKRNKFDWNEICDRETRSLMLAYSIPLIFNGISWWINSALDKYILTFFCGVSINGIYAVSSKIPTLLSTIQNIFGQAWSISAIKDFDKDDKDGFFTNMYSLYNCVSVIGASALILVNILIAKLLFSNDFFVAWQYSSILVYSAVFSGLAGFAGGIFSVVRKTDLYAVSTVVAAIVNTVLNFILIPKYSALGAAIATAISFVVIWLIRVYYASKYINWRISFKKDIFAYILLALQIVFEHTETHMYLCQALIFMIIVFLYKETLIKMLNLLKTRFFGGDN